LEKWTQMDWQSQKVENNNVHKLANLSRLLPKLLKSNQSKGKQILDTCNQKKFGFLKSVSLQLQKEQKASSLRIVGT